MKRHLETLKRLGAVAMVVSLILLATIFFLQYNGKYKITIDEELIALNHGDTLNLSAINPSKWDTVYILKPYASFNEFNIDIPESIKRELNNTMMLDGLESLLFSYQRKLVNYTTINRSNITFTDSINTFSCNEAVFFLEKQETIKRARNIGKEKNSQ